MECNSKHNLIQAAIKEFSKHRYEGASTRAIAKRANINISAIAYHFGGKQGLYDAVLEYISKTLVSSFSDLIERYDNIDNSKECSTILLKEFIAKFLNTFAGEVFHKEYREVFFAEYFKPSESFIILYTNSILPFYDFTSNLLIRSAKNKMTKEEAFLHMFPTMSQMTVFAARKEPFCKLMKWETFGEEEKAIFLKSIYKQIDLVICAQ